MPTATFRTALPVDAATAFAWHRRPGAFERLTPPWEDLQILSATDRFADGTRWTFRSRLFGPIRANWTVEHFDVIDGRQFCYRLLNGPLRKWEHRIRFLPDGPHSILESEIDYRLPLAGPFVSRRIERMFRWRNAIVAEDLKRHAQVGNRQRLTIAVTGSRGLVGTDLVQFLVSGGHRVRRLVSGTFQKPVHDDGTDWIAWRPTEPLPKGMLNHVDAVIHLAGENVAKGRWTTRKKQSLLKSRVIPTKHLADAVQRDGVPVFL